MAVLVVSAAPPIDPYLTVLERELHDAGEDSFTARVNAVLRTLSRANVNVVHAPPLQGLTQHFRANLSVYLSQRRHPPFGLPCERCPAPLKFMPLPAEERCTTRGDADSTLVRPVARSHPLHEPGIGPGVETDQADRGQLVRVGSGDVGQGIECRRTGAKLLRP